MAYAPRILSRFLLLFVVVLVIEVALLVWIGGRIGFWPTAGLLVGTAVLGSALAQREGLSLLARFRGRMAAGEMPGAELTDGLIILVSGMLLFMPGVLTDVVGLVGLFPPSRTLIRQAIARRFQRGIAARSHVATWAAAPPEPEAARPVTEDVVDVAFEDVPPR